MSKFKKHVIREMKQWEQSQAHELTKIRAAQRHLIYNVVAYLAISILEYWLAAISQSQTLRADAFNNLVGDHLDRSADDGPAYCPGYQR